jgi:hypothetical protein
MRPVTMPTIAFLDAATTDERILVLDDVSMRLPIPIIAAGRERGVGFLNEITIVRDGENRLGGSLIAGAGFIIANPELDGYIWPQLSVEDVVHERHGDTLLFTSWRIAGVYLLNANPLPLWSAVTGDGGLLPITIGE